ncbi:beta-1,3-galactosyltransferase brn-like [Daphnia carinata]|uniref:beta-1,3-galactosyltransferase brn-like n=1 Tax=Daphnia carinata TaxID=120202 RepID=UPI00257B79F3|nr:beta-1,3-galactosyltransferase brn-like [Daphnia carinata]
MNTTIRFRKNYLLFFATLIVVYITTAMKKTDVAQPSYDVLMRDNQHGQPIDQLEQIASMSNEQKRTSDESVLLVGREYFQYLTKQFHETPYPGVDMYTQYVVTRLQLKPLRGVEALRPNFGPVLNDVKSFGYPIKISPCREDAVYELPRLFVAIISAVSYVEKRRLIRQTWLRHLRSQSDSGSSIQLVGFGFVVGRTHDRDLQLRIESESSTYGDILQIDMADVYSNLTLKTVGLLNFIGDHCSRIDFVLKVDDDVYVNARNLVSLVRQLDPAEKSVYGTSTTTKVPREGKFALSKEIWPWSNLPFYCMGAAVLIPASTIDPLLAACQTTPYFTFEDLYLVGLCTSKAGIRVRDSVSLLGEDAKLVPKPCYVQDTITWLTKSDEHFNNSNWATESFYKNVTPCFFKGLDGTREASDPMQVIEFSFD